MAPKEPPRPEYAKSKVRWGIVWHAHDQLAAVRHASTWLDRISESLSLIVEQRVWWFLAGLSALYALGTSALAWSKLLWFDEILTYHLAQLPSFTALWAALRAGLDLNPPLYFVVAQFTRFLLGDGELVMRMPAMIGFWVMCICLFRFVSRGCTPLYGLAALLLPAATTAYKYAVEARPYGLLMGLCGVALVSWQSYARDRSRRGLVIMSLSLAGAVSTHYYALLIVLPFAAAELVRMITQRKLDFRVLVALATAGVPLLFCLPQLRMASTFAATFWAKPDLESILTFYGFLLGPGLFLLVITLAGVVALNKMQERRAVVAMRGMAPTAAEITVAIGFVLLPIVSVLFAILAGSGFTWRYVLTSVIGIAALVPIGAYITSRGRMAIGAALALVFVAAFGYREISASRRLFQNREALETYAFFSEQKAPDLPVVIMNPLQFLKIAHYGPAEWTRRAAYIINPPISVRYGESDTADRALVQLRKLTPLNVFDYQDFVNRYRHFLVYGAGGWEIAYLADESANIRVLGRYNKDLLFQVAVHADQ